MKEALAIAARVFDERAAFDARIEAIADDARALMLPYFKRRGWSYRAGNGTWLIEDKREMAIDNDKLPAWLYQLLMTHVADNMVLGYSISDIKI